MLGTLRARRRGWAALGAVAAALSLGLPLTARAWTSRGTVTTVAGTGKGFAGDGGPAAAARLNEPRMMTFGPAGEMYIADTFNHVVRKVDQNGVITTFAGAYPGPVPASDTMCPPAFAGDGGPATQASLRCPHSVVVEPNGDVIIADSGNNRIRKVDAWGTIQTIVGTGAHGFQGDGGPAVLASLNDPKGLALDLYGNLLIADSINHRIRKVDANGIITTIAGTGLAADSGDGGPAALASLNKPRTLSVAPDGSLLIAEPLGNRIRRIDPLGIITTVAGTGVPGFSGDGGPAVAAQLNSPRGVTADAAGNVFIADSDNNRIRRVDRYGIITTIGGNGTPRFGGDGGLIGAAFFSGPRCVLVGANGDLWVADTMNHRIRKVDGPTSDLGLPVTVTDPGFGVAPRPPLVIGPRPTPGLDPGLGRRLPTQ
jgi:streptogramin lyase